MTDPEQPVPVGDVDIALRVAQGVRSGGRADREPTLEQLLAAFGETEPTPAARHRARSALALAGVTAMPDLGEAAPGTRVRLLATDAGGSGGPSPAKALAGVGALAAVIVGIALAASLGGGEDPGDERLSDALPAGTTTAPAATSVATVAPPLTATTTAPTTTGPPTTTTATTTATAPTTTATTEAEDEPTAAERRAAARRARERRARREAAERRARARRPITVRLNAPTPTYLCVDRGPGTQPLFAGTLTGRRTFRARRVRLNVGLASTEVRKNGRVIPLTASPTGLDLTRSATRTLGDGARPSC